MAIQSYFFNAVKDGDVYDRVYNADDFNSYLDKLVGNGVFADPADTLQVRAGSGMHVIVAPGQGWINGHKLVNTADLTLTITAADSLLTRYDAVIFYVDNTTRTMGIEVKTGIPASSPVAPDLQRDSDRWELMLALITVKKQVTSITNSNIRDTRSGKQRCGYVQGLITQIDTEGLFQQYDAAFNEWFDEIKAQFQPFQGITRLEAVYTVQTTGEDEFNVQTLIPQFNFLYDVMEVYLNGFHLTGNDYTLTNAVVKVNNPLNRGQILDFVIYHVDNPNP